MSPWAVVKNQRRKTFSELVTEPTWSQTDAAHTGRHARRQGMFNAAGEFFDRDGRKLLLQEENVAADQAQRLVDAGAEVAEEGCGCGGRVRGCTPRWLSDDELSGLRGGPAARFTEGCSPTWIDVWANETVTVVFAHGDVSWGTAI